MGVLGQDVRFALRSLKKNWVITTVAIVSLSLAVGGNAAVFSMVDAFILRPLPYPEPERVVIFEEVRKEQAGTPTSFTASLPTFADLKERSRTIDLWAALRFRGVSVRGTERAEVASAAEVSPSYFEVLGAGAARGRTFVPGEAVEGGPPVVLVSQEYRAERWGPDHDPLGETLVIDGEPREVVGVLPAGFGFLGPSQDLYLPLTRSPSEAERDARNYFVMGRMTPSASMEQVRAETSTLASRLESEFPESFRDWTIQIWNLRYDLPPNQTRVLFGLLQGAVALVLVIACVNIANLLLARGQERGREIALRTVLGAGRARILRQLLTESGVLVGVAALGGVGLAALGIELISRNFAGQLPANFDPVLDHRVLLFTLGISALAGLAFGLLPALQTLRTDHASALREGGGRGGAGRSRKTLSRVLVVAEIALSFVALGGGSLLVRSFLDLRGGDPGFDGGNLLTATVRIPSTKYPDDDERLILAQEVLQRAERVAGVTSAALASSLPQTPLANPDSFRVAGGDPQVEAPRASVVVTSPSYVETFEIEVLRGRYFGSGDGLDDDPVAVVNQALARARFESGDPVGRRIEVRGESREVVGVVENVTQTLFQVGPSATDEVIYLPHGQSPLTAPSLAIRTRSDPRLAADPLRQAIQDVDPDVALGSVLTMDEYVDQFFSGVTVFNTILGGFGVMALLMASLGTYGVLAYSVGQRRREIGIRMAVGARSGQVVAMIARSGITMAVVGLGLGVLLTLPLVGILRSLLQNLSTVRPDTLVVIGVVLFGVTVVASLLPARRASAVDPVQTLKEE